MREKTKRVPPREDLVTRPMMANTMAKKVVSTAANWGLFPNGAATKNDQLARTNPSRTWRNTMRPALVSLKMRKCQVNPTMIHAGRYVREILVCQDLGGWFVKKQGEFNLRPAVFLLSPEVPLLSYAP